MFRNFRFLLLAALLLPAPLVAQKRICDLPSGTVADTLHFEVSASCAASRNVTWGALKADLGLSGYVPAGRTITCTAPLLCAGGTSHDLSSNFTISVSTATTSASGVSVLATPTSDTTAGHVVQASDPRLPPAPSTDDTLLLANGSAWQTKNVPNCTDTGGNHLNYTASTNAFSCGASSSGGGGGSGTVTSVNVSVPSWLSATGGPVTTTGTIAIGAATGQTPGRYVGTCGAATSVGLCAIPVGDLPTITTAKGGTGLDTSSSTGVPKVASGTWSIGAGISDLASSTSAALRGVLSDESGGGAALFGTSPTATDLTTNQAANGDVAITSTRSTDTSPTGSFLLFKNAAGSTLFGIDITGSLSAGTVPVARVSGLAASATTDATNASNISAGTLAVARGGTGTGSTLTGLVRGSGTAMTAAELSGDATTSGSNAVTVGKINGVALSGLGTGILKNTTSTGAPSIAVAADFPTLNQSTAGNAATATALAANGSNCSAGSFPLGMDAFGASESCTALPTSISGTTNQIAVSGSTGAITISIPSSPTLPGTTSGTFSGNLTGNVTGNASTASALAANGANCSSGAYSRGVDTLGNAEGCTADNGENNTASNVGSAGVGVFDGKTGVDLTFRKLNAASAKISITLDAGNQKIDLDVPDASTSGKGAVQLATDGNTSAGEAVQGSDSRLARDFQAYKVTTEVVINSDTPQDDDVLFFTVPAGKYRIEIVASIHLGNATHGFQSQVNGTATLASALFLEEAWDSSGAPVAGVGAGSGGVVLSDSGDVNFTVRVVGSVDLSSSGTIGWRWAQAVAGVSSTQVGEGSYMTLHRLN